MKAVVVGAQGVELAQVPMPAPEPEEVLVRVHAAGLNRADLAVAAGHQHGSQGGVGTVIGMEWAGVVEAVGTRVQDFAPGDAVMGSGKGAYAEYAVADRGRVYKLPGAKPDFQQAATLPIALQTAHDALVSNGGLQRGGSVVVQGASSGVGLMCLRMARLLGAATVIGTSTNTARRARLAEFGATLSVDSSDPAWTDQVLAATGGKGVDLVIDFIAGATMNQNLLATRLGGTIVNVGRLGGFKAEFDFDLHALRRIRYVGVTFRTRTVEDVREVARRMQADLWTAVGAGQLQLPLDRVFPLERAADALAYMRANAHFGKVVLSVPAAGES